MMVIEFAKTTTIFDSPKGALHNYIYSMSQAT